MGYEKENYVTRDARIDVWETHINAKILEQYSHLLEKNVVDFGCNHAACTIIAARNENIESICGVDINAEAITQGNNLLSQCSELQKNKDKVFFVIQNLVNLDRLNDNEFDSGFSFHTLEHIYQDDLDKVLLEWKRVLKDKSHLIISIPYENAYPDPCHVSFFNEESLSQLFHTHNFMTKECYRDQRDGFDCLTAIFQLEKENE